MHTYLNELNIAHQPNIKILKCPPPSSPSKLTSKARKLRPMPTIVIYTIPLALILNKRPLLSLPALQSHVKFQFYLLISSSLEPSRAEPSCKKLTWFKAKPPRRPLKASFSPPCIKTTPTCND